MPLGYCLGMAFRKSKEQKIDDFILARNWQGAEAACLDALSKTTPESLESADVLVRYGHALVELGRFEHAEQALAQGVDIRRDAGLYEDIDWQASMNLAKALRALGDLDVAADEYQTACEVFERHRGTNWSRLIEGWVPLAKLKAELDAGNEAFYWADKAHQWVEQFAPESLEESGRFYQELDAILQNHKLRKLETHVEQLTKIQTPVAEPTVKDPISRPRPELDSQTRKQMVEEILAELDAMIGLSSVKTQARSLINFIQVQQARQASGAKPIPRSYHMVFTGNPGTGKTTVARLFAKIFYALGILETEKVIETDRSGMVAGYIGQSATKTNDIIDKALDGVLFIDEAYSLAGKGDEDFGNEAVSTLLLRMENERARLIVIVAGYEEPMRTMIGSNPGLKSRFNNVIRFPDYSSVEMMQIFESLAGSQDYVLTPSAKRKVLGFIEDMERNKGDDFANARDVRNLFEAVVAHQANRIMKLESLEAHLINSIESDDIPASLDQI